MVEAFSIRGLARLATSWTRNPPFKGDVAFAAKIRKYRQALIGKYRRVADRSDDAEIGAWFQRSRPLLESRDRKREMQAPVILKLLELMRVDACVEDLSAVNRWASRSGVPLEDYLMLWEASCTEIHTSGRLPSMLKSLLQLT